MIQRVAGGWNKAESVFVIMHMFIYWDYRLTEWMFYDILPPGTISWTHIKISLIQLWVNRVEYALEISIGAYLSHYFTYFEDESFL